MLCKIIYQITGIVQGVGFRPYLYRLATAQRLSGWVSNRSDGVWLCLEGESVQLDAFIAAVRLAPPPNARIANIVVIEKIAITQCSLTDFQIYYSVNSETSTVTIPADLALCPDCRREILDPENRRYHHPFATCVNCGPRYTVIKHLPYDRANTTMAAFPLCRYCQDEYSNPADRRFHAETIACPECGPQIQFTDISGNVLPVENPLQAAAAALQQGAVIAMRGIGGFQLLANAFNCAAVSELRRRKRRPDKPFALMAVSTAVISRYCHISAAAEQLLKSPAAPAVILPVQAEYGDLPIDLISPDTATLGWMLPYTPLHQLLFEYDSNAVLIATSGNRGGEPIALSNQEAVTALGGIADYFLFHNREIMLRNDDSVAVITDSLPQLWRRARGYAPQPLNIPGMDKLPAVVAFGADLKNCVAASSGAEVLVSPYIGDLENPPVFDFFVKTAANLSSFIRLIPQVAAVDLHPDMLSVRYGEKFAADLRIPLQRVQHHHAHAVSCLAEHGVTAGLALVFDGAGYGADGTSWGAELLYADYADYIRLATFRASALPGGDAAVRQPIRQLAARLIAAGIVPDVICRHYPDVTPEQIAAWQLQINKKINAPLTHSAGRLFDAAAMLLKLAPEKITYEGQAAIRLEAAARRYRGEQLVLPEKIFQAAEIGGLMQVDWMQLFAAGEALLQLNPETAAVAAYNFHVAVADAAVVMVEFALAQVEYSKVSTIALSGGVFQNLLLTEILLQKLRALGLNVLLHRRLPPNDGGIAYGQAVIAAAKIKSGFR